MIDSAPKVMTFAIDPYKDFIQVPLPVRKRVRLDSALPYLGREQWAEPVPPKPNRLMADVGAALKEHILDLAERQQIPSIHHHG